MSRRMIPPLRGRIDACTDPTVMKQSRINQLDVGEESIDELLGANRLRLDKNQQDTRGISDVQDQPAFKWLGWLDAHAIKCVAA